MPIANHIDANTLWISGEHNVEFPYGRRVLIVQGPYGSVWTTVYFSYYDSDNARTVIALIDPVVTEAITFLYRGVGSPLTIATHFHTSNDDGGWMPASQMNEEDTADHAENVQTEMLLRIAGLQSQINHLTKRISELENP